MVELTVNGQALELRKGSEIKYTMRIAEVYNIAAVACGYTNAFSIPKTPNNTQIFRQLGLVGDTSTVPYERVPVRLKHHGFTVIKKGWLKIMSTKDVYSVAIHDGMIDFFKAIENKTMGVDLDLSAFSHTKVMSSVLASYTNDFYKYIIADYNGKNNAQVGEVSGINIDYLIPCFSVQKLWDIIFSTFGYTYNPEPLSFIDGLYITYPKPPQEDAEPELIATANKTNWNSSVVSNWQGQKYVPSQEFWSAQSGVGWDGWTFVVPETGSYMFEVATEAYVRFIHPVAGAVGDYPATINIIVNGTVILAEATDQFAEVVYTKNWPCQQGDVVQIRLSSVNPSPLTVQFRHLNTNFSIYTTDLGDVSLIESLKDFSIKDFIKEILWRTALTPVIDTDTNYIDFIPLSQRLDFSNAVDWSEKYVKRIDEKYDAGLAQKNIFKLMHNNEVDTRGDGYLYINDKNLKDEQTIAASKMFAPETFKAAFQDATGTTVIKTDTYKVWEKEPKANEEGEIEIDYKGLNNRYHFVRLENHNATFNFVSEFLEDTGNYTNVPFAINNETLFDELVFKNWSGYDGVLNNFRSHSIELVLSLTDILELDLTRPVYFSQEAQYYMINSISWQEGKTCTGEFIRINKQ